MNYRQPVSKARSKLVLQSQPSELRNVARRVVADLGWEVEHAKGALLVYEDATRLHCHCSPLRAELKFKAAENGETELVITGTVAGWGPIASQHVREQTDLLTRRLGLAAVNQQSS
ncbi:MAG: hypothetical protein BroJett024_43380 [Alphaproteobacteria bacterium]|nr:MAG: hypothetical protein BroJett024_43380 [Alphaproteobacteria bacterium]